MKTYGVLAVSFGLLAFLAVPAAAQTYDNSPSHSMIFPECIWAAATGGGDWVSELQIQDMSGGTVIQIVFRYGTTSDLYRAIPSFWVSPGQWHSVKFSNILSTMQSLDPSFTYYGRVGALMLYTQDTSHLIQATIRTVNGNYGKTFPGLRQTDSNTANLDRAMMITELTQDAAYRTFVGFFNSTNGGGTMTARFFIIDENNDLVGNFFQKTFAPWTVLYFNPFVEAGVGSGPYDNCWLLIDVLTSTNSGTDSWGLFCFGSSANNYTNDTSAHIAVQFQ